MKHEAWLPCPLGAVPAAVLCYALVTSWKAQGLTRVLKGAVDLLLRRPLRILRCGVPVQDCVRFTVDRHRRQRRKGDSRPDTQVPVWSGTVHCICGGQHPGVCEAALTPDRA